MTHRELTANVDARNTIAIVAGEQIAEARPSFGLAVLWRFVGSLAAIVVAVWNLNEI